ncbi:MAG: hypothetical protein ACE5F8_07685 [Woeseiaceae bacterium]
MQVLAFLRVRRYKETMISARQLANRTASGPRRALLLVAVAWLNMTMAPCAMAFGSDFECPHMSSGAHAGMAAHDGHHANSTPTGCDGVQSSCCDAQDVANDVRADRSDTGKFSDAPATLCSHENVAPKPAGQVTAFSSGALHRCSDAPPLHLLNCVFLD